jgi:hypothetical protein
VCTGILDVTASDVLAGMVLLRHVQKAQEHELVSRSESSINDGTSCLNFAMFIAIYRADW